MAQMETDPPDITNSCEERNRLSLEIEALDIVINRCSELLNFPDTDDNHEMKAILRASTDDTQRKKDTMDEVEKLAYQLNEEAERTERPIRRLSKVMYGSTCADMQVDVMRECLSSIKHVVGVRSVLLAKRLPAV
ncbi:uncharacterized protein TNCV_1722391 [Trichonephila clavipes]|nr:uncharacterized protein TNCV_1722391 [Trichonephila clavipes]